MRERGIYPQDCPRTVRSRRNRCGNTELACSPKYHVAKTACAVGRQSGLRPESCWNDCLTRRKWIRLCVPSHVAYEVGAARQQTVRSPRTMDPHSQEWHRNCEATVYLPA